MLAFKRMNTTYTIYTTHRINKKITYQYESSGELLNEKTLYKLLCSPGNRSSGRAVSPKSGLLLLSYLTGWMFCEVTGRVAGKPGL